MGCSPASFSGSASQTADYPVAGPGTLRPALNPVSLFGAVAVG